MKKISLFRALFFSVLLFFFYCQRTLAGVIEQVKNKSILIKNEGALYDVGQILQVLNFDNKVIGVARVRKTNRSKSVATLSDRSTAEVGFKVRPRPAKSSVSKTQKPNPNMTSIEPSKDSRWGFMGGLSMTSSDVDLFNTVGTKTGTASLDGFGLSAKALYDYSLLPKIQLRGLAGLEQFNVSGKTDPACKGKCEVEIMYMTFDFWGRFIFKDKKNRLWAGTGAALLFPVSKNASALKEASITNTNVFLIGGGIDFKRASGRYIPLQLEYQMYPSSDTVKANVIALKAGLTFK